MTDLLKELEAVVAGLDECTDGVAESHYKALRFLRTHHAEIAEALKDARRMDWLERNAINITLDGRLHRVMQIGTARDSIDTAMHNSAREAGE
jgi:hypothetical protein